MDPPSTSQATKKDPPAAPERRNRPLEALSVPRPVDRIDYLVEQCRGQRVLDLGALDETELGRPQHRSWRWLHAELARVALGILGVDASPQLEQSGVMQTTAGSQIVFGKVEALGVIVAQFKPDIIVAGELIEHTADTLGWLTQLSQHAPGTRFLATTPNATSIINIVLSFFRRENAHEDHLHVYSFKTLTTLSARVGLVNVSIRPYYYRSHLFRSRVPRWLLPVVYLLDYGLLTPIQFLFPLTAGGLILEGIFPGQRVFDGTHA